MSRELRGAIKLRGRVFSQDEISRIRAIVEESPGEHRFALSKRICEELGWRQDNGRLKDRSCRDVLLKLSAAGLLCLPDRRRPPRRRRPIPITSKTDPRLAPSLGPRDVDVHSFSIITASGRRSDELLWNEYVERYHYLGFGVPVGPHIKYLVHFGGEPVACIAFSGAAWKIAPRDSWIGWCPAVRERNLRLIVNNSRFLILPWIRVDNLASRILALALRRLPDDWHKLYAYRPVLVETFVHADRHRGTCYVAAGWTCIGVTKGRGKMDRYKAAALMLPILSLGVWFSILCTISESVLLGIGRPSYGAIANLIKLVWLVIGLPVGVIYFGVAGAIGAMASADLVKYLPLLRAQRVEHIAFFRQDILITLALCAMIVVWRTLFWSVGLSGGLESLWGLDRL